MEKILNKLKNFGFIKGEHQLLNQDEAEKLKTNIEKVLGKKDFTKYKAQAPNIINFCLQLA